MRPSSGACHCTWPWHKTAPLELAALIKQDSRPEFHDFDRFRPAAMAAGADTAFDPKATGLPAFHAFAQDSVLVRHHPARAGAGGVAPDLSGARE